MNELLKNAYNLSVKVRENAYSPYSKFKVGASLISKCGDIFTGCNVENVSYGGTICAERNAIIHAVSTGIKTFDGLIVTTDLEEPAYPCGLCLQVISEFCDKDFKIYLANLDGIKKEYTLKDFLPMAFKKFIQN